MFIERKHRLSEQRRQLVKSSSGRSLFSLIRGQNTKKKLKVTQMWKRKFFGSCGLLAGEMLK